MANASELLSKIRAAGFAVREELGRLIVSPASKLTADQRAAIMANRDALLLLLGRDDLADRMAAYDPDPAHGSVQLVELAILDLDGRTVAVDARKHKALCERVEMWNKAAMERRK